MKANEARLVAIALAATIAGSLVGCESRSRNPSNREADMLNGWYAEFRHGGDRSLFLSDITALDPTVGFMDGELLWRGAYRGIPIALYSCLFRHNTFYQVEHPGEYPADTAGVRWLRIILAVERPGSPYPGRNPPYTGPAEERMRVEQVAMTEFPGKVVDLKALGYRSDPTAPEELNPALLEVKVTDAGNGMMKVAVNALAKGQACVFDLEKALSKEQLKGPKRIEGLKFPEYSVEQFVQVTLDKLGKLKPTGEPWWRGTPRARDLGLLYHPLWENPEAVRLLLNRASEKQLVNAIKCLGILSRGVHYRNAAMEAQLLGYLRHESGAVRGAFSWVVAHADRWPRNPRDLEPFLQSEDPNVLFGVLSAFVLRRHVPKDIERVRELAGSKEASVRDAANELLLKATGKCPWEEHYSPSQ